MAVNRVQFQRGLSMAEFHGRYGTAAQCEAALAKSRWPEGFRCPKCSESKHCLFEREGRTYWECGQCGQQVTVTSGTIFQATKLPLTSWFLAMHLLTQAKNNMSALALMRHLGVSYRTAWTVKHKLLQVMGLQEEARVLSGQVEVLHTVIGGRRRAGDGRKRVRGTPVLLAVQKCENGRPQSIQISPVLSEKAAINAWAEKVLEKDARIQQPHPKAKKSNLLAETLHARLGKSTASINEAPKMERRCASPLIGNINSAMSGTYHAVNFEKYGSRYLAEAQYRFNRRSELRSMLGELMGHALRTRPHKEYVLRAA